MIRKAIFAKDYTPVKVDGRIVTIQFDKVDIESSDENAEKMSVVSVIRYFEAPTSEKMQEDVRKFTEKRYKDDGLTPPEEIDLKGYHL